MAKLYLLPGDSPPRPKPTAALRRFQLLKTSAVYSHLHGYYLLTQVDKQKGKTGLLLPSADDDDWERAVHNLCSLAARLNWFAVDWDLIDDIWRLGMELGEEEQFHTVSHFLYVLPLKLFGWHPEDLWEDDLAARLRALLLSEDEKIVSLPFDWGKEDKLKAWARLEDIERDPGRYPKTVHLLPAICRWVTNQSGNFILDTCLEPYDYHPVYLSFIECAGAPTFKWHTWQPDDLKKVRAAWREAEPVVRSYNRLQRWYLDDENNVFKLLHFIRTGRGLAELNW